MRYGAGRDGPSRLGPGHGFTTPVRFDAVYYGDFECNLRRVVYYLPVQNYAHKLYRWPGVRDTVDFDHTKGRHHNSRHINLTGIVPSARRWTGTCRTDADPEAAGRAGGNQ